MAMSEEGWIVSGFTLVVCFFIATIFLNCQNNREARVKLLAEGVDPLAIECTLDQGNGAAECRGHLIKKLTDSNE